MIYDYIVIGSGFGGSVASLLLVEKGYRPTTAHILGGYPVSKP